MNANRARRGGAGLAALLLLLMAGAGVDARAACPEEAVNRLAVNFTGDPFEAGDCFQVQLDDSVDYYVCTGEDELDGYWINQLELEDRFFPDRKTASLSFPNNRGQHYRFTPAMGLTRELPNGLCYGFYAFKVDRISWTLDVEGKPPTNYAFRYDLDYRDTWEWKMPPGPDWHRVSAVGIGADVRVDVFEQKDNERIFLFRTREFSRSDALKPKQSELEFNQRRIAGAVLEQRLLLVGRGERPPEGDRVDDSTDPYLEMARRLVISGESREQRTALEKKLAQMIALKKLTLCEAPCD